MFSNGAPKQSHKIKTNQNYSWWNQYVGLVVQYGELSGLKPCSKCQSTVYIYIYISRWFCFVTITFGMVWLKHFLCVFVAQKWAGVSENGWKSPPFIMWMGRIWVEYDKPAVLGGLFSIIFRQTNPHFWNLPPAKMRYGLGVARLNCLSEGRNLLVRRTVNFPRCCRLLSHQTRNTSWLGNKWT